MSPPFSRTLRALDADGGGHGLAIGLGAAVLGLWATWFTLGEITVYEGSEAARLEVAGTARGLVTAAAGEVLSVPLEQDAEVGPGDVILELDPGDLELELAEATARRDGARARIDPLEAAIAAEEQALQAALQALGGSREEARARLEEAEAAAILAEAEARQAETLARGGNVSAQELGRLQSLATQRRAAARAAGLGLSRLGEERQRIEGERQARIEGLREQMALQQGEIAAAEALMARLEREIDRMRVRAPVGGTLGELVPLRPGDRVEAGARIGAVLPAGELQVVALLEPAAALGRVQPGQRARVRLDGFPWTAYGSLDARVEQVAAEPRDGAVRVELEILTPQEETAIPLQHGLEGTVEIAVEEASPMSLVLRAAGRRLEAR